MMSNDWTKYDIIQISINIYKIKSFNTSISYQYFDYKLTFVNFITHTHEFKSVLCNKNLL